MKIESTYHIRHEAIKQKINLQKQNYMAITQANVANELKSISTRPARLRYAPRHVRPSVRPSVCLSVRMCDAWRRLVTQTLKKHWMVTHRCRQSQFEIEISNVRVKNSHKNTKHKTCHVSSNKWRQHFARGSKEKIMQKKGTGITRREENKHPRLQKCTVVWRPLSRRQH